MKAVCVKTVAGNHAVMLVLSVCIICVI